MTLSQMELSDKVAELEREIDRLKAIITENSKNNEYRRGVVFGYREGYGDGISSSPYNKEFK